MTNISACKINGVEAVHVQIKAGRVSAEIGFLIDSGPFGAASITGLDEYEEVRNAADALQLAIETAVAGKIGSPVGSTTFIPPSLIDPSL